MCIAIYKPADVNISRETLNACFDNNPDGCGFAYINVDRFGISRIKMKKTMSFTTFYRQYERATRVNPDSPFLIHFRIATHGTIDKFNCHPFEVTNNKVFIHNGIITNVGIDTKKSDTQMFNDKVLKKLPEEFEKNTVINKLIGSFIGASKLVLMDVEGNVTIVNESKGLWKAGVWWSNTSYVVRPSYYTTNSRYNTGTWKPARIWDNVLKEWIDNPKSKGGARGVQSFPNKEGEGRNSMQSSQMLPEPDTGNVNVERLTLDSIHACDSCRDMFKVSSLRAFRNTDGILPTLVCKGCRDEGISSGFFSHYDVVAIDSYTHLYNYRMGSNRV